VKRRTRKIVTRVIVFLLLGVIVNVAVAWVAPYLFGEKHVIQLVENPHRYQWDPAGPNDAQRGWPLPSLWTEVPRPGGSWVTAIVFQFSDGSTMEFGFCPIWPGFAINTMFYAGMLWIVFAARSDLRRWRRWRRIRRGLCPACAYPVGTSPVCTECGTALPSTA
jgi:hypothetical protein